MTFVTFVVSVSDRYCNHRGFYQIFNVFNDYTKVIEHISLNMNVCLIILYFICILLISFYVIKTNLGNKTMFLSFIIMQHFVQELYLDFHHLFLFLEQERL